LNRLKPLYFVFLLVVFGCKKETIENNWELVYFEDFNSSLDTISEWRRNFPWFRFNYNQVYLNSNVLIENGYLNLIGTKELFSGKGVTYLDSLDILHDEKPNFRNFDYRSGMVFLNKKYKYGKFEIRCKIPKGKGLWPAFWLYGPCGEEIDIFEFDCEFPKRVHTARHKMFFCSETKNYHFPEKFEFEKDFSNSFHIFSLEWNKSRIAWFIDEELIREEILFNDVVYQNSFPDSSLNLIINLAITGSFVKSEPELKTGDSATFQIDYLKIYK
jgi:beta-glucanase (GH16 family)